MSSRPYVTALIDTYNQGRFIEEAIDSVLAQDFPARQMEILVVDDGSADDTRARVEKYGERIRYIWKPNGGQASALNLGFQRAQGEIVAFLDADDVWLPEKIRRIVEEFSRHPDAAVVYHPCIFWDPENDSTIPDTGFCPVTGHMPLDRRSVLRYGDYATSCMALRREAAAPFFPIPGDLQIYADSYLIFLAIFVGVAAVPEHLSRYRMHDANLASHRLPDPEKFRRRWTCYAAAIVGGKAWLQRHGHDLSQPDLAAYVRRHELVEQMLKFQCEPPGRGEYFRYLRDFQKLYASLWTARYRAFRTALSLAGLVAGYSAFESLRGRYRGSVLAHRREALFPAKESGGEGAATGKQSVIAVP